jgi:hypothetical protein
MAELVSCVNVFLDVMFTVLRSLGRRPLLEHVTRLEFHIAPLIDWPAELCRVAVTEDAVLRECPVTWGGGT